MRCATCWWRSSAIAATRRRYDDLRNADLAAVIQRRRGLPVALSILYIHAARSLGWRIEGLNFPGHFVIRLHGDRQAVILDPFAGGLARSIQDLRQLLKAQSTDKTEVKPEHFSALENRQILLRLQNNIKVRRIQEGDLKGAERALQRMLWIAPTRPSCGAKAASSTRGWRTSSRRAVL